MDDGKFRDLITRKYAQIVLKLLLDGEQESYALCELRDEVNTIIADDSIGAEEKGIEGQYSDSALSSLLSDAQDAGIVKLCLNQDGEKRWELNSSQLSPSQKAEVRDKNKSGTNHMDSASYDRYW